MTINHQPSTLNRLSRYWLMIGVVALAIAGLYSLTLVIGRAPMLSNNVEVQRIFHSALVVHVDLSVLLWFLSIACLFWSMATHASKSVLPYLEEAALICFALAIVLMMISPFAPGAEALMSNYIPAISSPIFLLSLGLLLSGVGFMLVKLFTSRLHGFELPVAFGLLSSGWITLISIACFLWSYHLMPRVFEGEQYFDMVFWGGGHVLQLTHTQILMVVWVLLLAAITGHTLHKKFLYPLFSIGLLAALASPLAYFFYDITGSEFRQFFTRGVMSIGGVAPGLLALALLPFLWKTRSRKNALWASLLVSVLLFIYGGVLALLIQGQNVIIPAHYHGSIVGITIGFMGFAYHMLPRFGWRDVTSWRTAWWQPIIYGVGQMMHVSGLAYSGGYGVLRKTAGGVDQLAPNIKIALGVMGMGGLFAIIGGLMFVVVVWRAAYRD